jgi:ATP-dependent helicase/nuclease subunit B
MILTKSNIEQINFELFLNSKILSEDPEKILLIVPTNRRLRDLKKKIINHFVDRPVSKIYIETLTTFSNKMLKEKQSFISLSEAAATVLLKEATEELKLSYFAAYSKGIPFGTLDKIKNVISEYKMHGILPEILLREAGKLEGGEKNKAIDIASIYNLYLKKCNTLSALEVGDVYVELINLNQNEFSSIFSLLYPEVETIVFDEFDEFTNLEIDIIDKLSNAVDNNLFINFDYHINNELLFSHLTNTFQYLQKNNFKRIFDTTPQSNSDFKNILRTQLFNKNKVNQNKNFIDRLHKYKARNRIEEVEFIAKSIKQQLIEKEVEPENICVAFNIIGNYSSIIRDTFYKYGIPINLTDRIPLKTSPPVVAAISMLELVENDFYFYDLGRVLTNGFFSFENIDFHNLLYVASELKITSGLQNWKTSIQDGISIIKYKEDLLEAEKKMKISQYKNAEKDIKHLGKLLLPFNQNNSSEEFIKNFKNLLLKLKLPYSVLEESAGKEEEFIKSVTIFLKTIIEVLILLDKNDEEKVHPLNYYIEQLRIISNWARFNIKERSDYGVLVTSVNEIRGLKFDYLFIGGFCDGDFPTRYSPEIFFSSFYQKKEQIHQTEERFHFYQALSTWEKKLFLTVPQKDSETELVESTFIKDLEKIFKFSEIKSEDSSTIFSTEQLQIEYARNKKNKSLNAAFNNIMINTLDLDKKDEIRRIRNYEPFGEKDHNGFIGSDEEIKSYLQVYSEREFSASQLETFAKCPFKYFAERILNLQPIEEPTEEAQPLELGNILHSILYEFYTKVTNEKISIGQRGSKEFDNLKKVLFEIAEKKINSLNLNSPLAFFEKEKIMGIDGIKENSILHKFLITETTSNSNLNPTYFEISFGNFFRTENSNVIPPLEIGALKLRGKVDRLDVDEENKIYDIVDYKLKGKKPTLPELEQGISLQLPVYLIAGEHILKEVKNEKYGSNKMTIYSLDYKDSNFGPLNVNLTRKKNIPIEEIQELNYELTKVTKQKMIEYHDKIKKGHFHLSPLENREDKVCKYCDFKSLCRVKEVFEG